MKSLAIICLGLLGFMVCNAQAPLTKEEIRVELETYSAEDNHSLVARITTAQALERKQIVDAVVDIAQEEAERVTLPFQGGGVDDPGTVRSRGILLNAGHVLGQAAEEEAILEAFGKSYRRIEPETRAGIARTLALCKDIRALNLIDDSARDAVEKLLGLDLINLSEDQKVEAELYAASLILSLEAMATSVNPAGEGKARAILADLERRSVGRPLIDKLVFAIKAESALQISADEPSDSLDWSSTTESPAAAAPEASTSQATEEPKPSRWPLVLAGVAVLGVLILLIRAFLHVRAS